MFGISGSVESYGQTIHFSVNWSKECPKCHQRADVGVAFDVNWDLEKKQYIVGCLACGIIEKDVFKLEINLGGDPEKNRVIYDPVYSLKGNDLTFEVNLYDELEQFV